MTYGRIEVWWWHNLWRGSLAKAQIRWVIAAEAQIGVAAAAKAQEVWTGALLAEAQKRGRSLVRILILAAAALGLFNAVEARVASFVSRSRSIRQLCLLHHECGSEVGTAVASARPSLFVVLIVKQVGIHGGHTLLLLVVLVRSHHA